MQCYVANVSAFEVLKVETRENLRDYIGEHNSKRRNGVHVQIRGTIDSDPRRFITLNSGFVITASAAKIDDNAKTIELQAPSLINGAQSQGEIQQYFSDVTDPQTGDVPDEAPFYVRAEIIIDADAVSVVETAIARNTSTPVKAISQAGARGHLEELEASIRAVFPNARIRKKETDVDVLETEHILQWTRLLMPESVSGNATAAERLRAYKNRKQCLTDFDEWFGNIGGGAEAKAKYDFTIQIAPFAVKEYEYWQTHAAWNGHNLYEVTKKGGRAFRRNKNGKINWAAPGLVFPILGAMSDFCTQDPKTGRWMVSKPGVFKPEEMVRHAVRQFRAHGLDPMQMGRSEAAYDALHVYTETLLDALRSVGDEKTDEDAGSSEAA
jgi:hypothetical protein